MAWINKYYLLMILSLSLPVIGKSIDIKLSDKIFKSYNAQLKKEVPVFLIRSGGGYSNGIEKIIAHYWSYQKLTIEDSRRLFVKIAEGYLNRYNEDKTVRPFLHNYPFTIGNLEITVGFKDEKNSYHEQGAVAFVFINERTKELTYCTFNQHTEDFVDLYKEPYELAREIVMSEKMQGGSQ